MLARAIPGERQVIGIDLAQGMVDVAQARLQACSDSLLRWAGNSALWPVQQAHLSSSAPSARSISVGLLC